MPPPEQNQHDMYGEILDCAWQWSRTMGAPRASLWKQLELCIGQAAARWNTPDQGIWEVRASGRPFTYSAALCEVALDRGSRMARQFSLSGDTAGWSALARHIREAILQRAWSDKRQALCAHLGGEELDASVLSLPLRRVVEADHPRMRATTDAIARELGAGKGLLYRYLPDRLSDGLAGDEGAFLLCSFWLVDNYTNQGRLEEALELYDALCARAGPLGLLPEEIDPSSGDFLGNYPQGFSHVGVISSGVNLQRALAGEHAPDKSGLSQ